MLLVVSGVQAWHRFLILVLVGATMWLVVNEVQAWCRFLILVLVGATMRLEVSGVQAWRRFLILVLVGAMVNKQMRRVRVAVISIGTMVGFELILFHGKLYFGPKNYLVKKN